MRLNSRYLAFVAIITAVLLAWFFWDSPERAIREVLAQGEAAVESKDLAGALSHVSRQYLDDNDLNYLAVGRVLTIAFNRFERLDVRFYDLRVDVKDANAKVTGKLQVLVSEHGDGAYLIGAPTAPEWVTLDLVKETFAWKVVNVGGIDISRLRL